MKDAKLEIVEEAPLFDLNCMGHETRNLQLKVKNKLEEL